jgi:GH24 family phage-related lysozyme (muramidase)
VADPRLLADLRKAEGCPLDKATGLPKAYKDGLGNWTGGYGHLLDQSIDWTGQVFGWDVVNSWLAMDTDDEAIPHAQSLPEWAALDTPCRQNAVIEAVFNLGLSHWEAEFPATRAAIRVQNWQSAHDNLLRSPLWIKEVGLARVTRLATYLLTGQYPGST